MKALPRSHTFVLIFFLLSFAFTVFTATQPPSGSGKPTRSGGSVRRRDSTRGREHVTSHSSSKTAPNPESNASKQTESHGRRESVTSGKRPELKRSESNAKGGEGRSSSSRRRTSRTHPNKPEAPLVVAEKSHARSSSKRSHRGTTTSARTSDSGGKARAKIAPRHKPKIRVRRPLRIYSHRVQPTHKEGPPMKIVNILLDELKNAENKEELESIPAEVLKAKVGGFLSALDAKKDGHIGATPYSATPVKEAKSSTKKSSYPAKDANPLPYPVTPEMGKANTNLFIPHMVPDKSSEEENGETPFYDARETLSSEEKSEAEYHDAQESLADSPRTMAEKLAKDVLKQEASENVDVKVSKSSSMSSESEKEDADASTDQIYNQLSWFIGYMPKQLQNYENLRRIGKGSYGSAFLADEKITVDEHKKAIRKVIVKQMRKKMKHRNPDQRPGQPKYRYTDYPAAYLKLELDAMRAVNGSIFFPQIYPPYQFQTQKSVFAECGPMSNFLALLPERNYFDAHRVVNDELELSARYFAAFQIAALDALHKRGFIHRDWSLNNIVVDGEGRPKGIDLGLCKRAQDVRDVKFGTYYVMPPEMFGKYQYFDECSDFYAVGVNTHDFIIGQPRYGFDYGGISRQMMTCLGTLYAWEADHCNLELRNDLRYIKLSEQGIDFIGGMLAYLRKQRLACYAVGVMKSHPWFGAFYRGTTLIPAFDWGALERGEMKSPWKKYVKNCGKNGKP